MSTNHHVKSFEEFLQDSVAEDLDPFRTKIPFDHTDDEEEELDDTESPELPEELKEEDRKRPVTRFLVDRELEDDENEEGEP
jgi:hypothetical protein